MALENTVKSVADSFRLNLYPSEKAISLQIVSTVLRDLDWNTIDPTSVRVEHHMQGGRADYALLDPVEHKPKVYVEVKQPHTLTGADEQAFGYAVTQGVRMLVITDGKTWSFYLPGEEGSYEDRRVARLDLTERAPNEAVESLIHYLGRSRVVDGVAIDDAVKELRDKGRRDLAAKTIPAAWNSLIEDEDPTLYDRLSSEVEAKCRHRPDPNDIAGFLRGLAPHVAISTEAKSRGRYTTQVQATELATGPSFTLHGDTKSFRTAQQMVAAVLGELTKMDPAFPEKCYRHADNTGRTRRQIARSPSELYPGRQDLEGYSIEFAPGWFVQTNVSNASKERIVRMACAVAGVGYGTDLKVVW